VSKQHEGKGATGWWMALPDYDGGPPPAPLCPSAPLPEVGEQESRRAEGQKRPSTNGNGWRPAPSGIA
jgi:hypothetical protein